MNTSSQQKRAAELAESVDLRATGAGSLVTPLRGVGRHDLALAGGKGANLGELTRAGMPVPPGFIVTTAAYDRFVADNHLNATIAQALAAEPVDAAAIRAAFEAGVIPGELDAAIRAAYKRLGQEAVAVRSSATAEDLPGAAFAGQQDTYLNIVGVDAVLDAVRRCFASLWTDRAVAYRARQEIDQQGVKLAVVVQRLVPSEAAGVLFTANPVTGARDEIVLDATPGLGEALVSGLVTPDHYVLRKRGWRGWQVAERSAGRGEVVIRPAPGGGVEHVSAEPTSAQPLTLTEHQARQLARLGMAIQRHFGAPQDIEWALAGGKLSIVQARPMTALPDPVQPIGPAGRFFSSLIAEMVPTRPYPVDATTWSPALLREALGFIMPFTGVAPLPFDQIFEVKDGIVIRFLGRLPLRPGPKLLLTPFRLMASSRRYDPTRWRDDPELVAAKARIHTLEGRDLSALSPAELLDTLREGLLLLRPLARDPRIRYLPGGALGVIRLRALLALVGGGKQFGTLLSSVETVTTETNRALEALAARIRAHPALAATFATHEATELRATLEREPEGRAFLHEFDAFLERYGYREGSVLLVTLPTWKDAPEAPLGALKGLAAAPPRSPAGKPAWEAARDALLTRSLLRFPPLRAAFLKALASARELIQIREDTHCYATMSMPTVRRSLLELGRRLVAVGALERPEDVFHLELGELERVAPAWPPSAELAGELRAAVRRRQGERAALDRTPVVDPRWFPRPKAEAGALLSGAPGSPGQAEGPARIIHGPEEFGKLLPGDVLVAPFTNPAWTPLFQRAIAVVVDSGAAGSHAAIVAREYSIPAVMGSVDGTRLLADGDRVRVDGGRGLVYRVATAASSSAPAAPAAERTGGDR